MSPRAAPSWSPRAAACAHWAAQAPLLPSRLSAWCHRSTATFFSLAYNKRNISSQAHGCAVSPAGLLSPAHSPVPARSRARHHRLGLLDTAQTRISISFTKHFMLSKTPPQAAAKPFYFLPSKPLLIPSCCAIQELFQRRSVLPTPRDPPPSA